MCSSNQFNFKEALCVALPSFGAGILCTLFLPPCVLVAVTAVASVAFGAICLMPY